MTKKRFLILAVILWSGVIANAQKKQDAAAKPAVNVKPDVDLYGHYKKIYDQAATYNDFVVARNALFSMISLRPDRAGLKDTLAYLYFSSNNYPQVIVLGKEILEANPDKPEILEVVAVSEQNLGWHKNALESFEKLFATTKDPYHQYSIATLQYMLKRFGECSESLNSIIGSSDSLGVVTISNNEGESQQVPLKAAAFNMRGVIALEINQSDVAKQNFQKALELFPEFALAKGNLDKANLDKANTPDTKKTPAKKD